MYNLIKNIEFNDHRYPDEFQRKLQKDVKEIKKLKTLLVPADKTTNLYSVPKDRYNKLLTENITKDYKKCETDVKHQINKEAKHIAQNLQLDDRIESFSEKNAFITLKDHKENFHLRPKCRLINPAKSEIGKISKQLLTRINDKLRSDTKVNQWKNTDSVITWFEHINNKQASKFLKFDIVEFYPSISEDLLTKAINFAIASRVSITREEKHIILHSRRSLLFNRDETWIKKNNEKFDVTMGSWDGAEICELVGLYILNHLPDKFGNLGLYRDDGLACLHRRSGRTMDVLRKEMEKYFKENFNLAITVETNLMRTDFLDITLDLETGKYSPFMKPNNVPLYINKLSNHPPTIIKQLPKMIQDRISRLSCDEAEFNKAKPAYQQALEKSDYDEEMIYSRHPVKKKRNRKRKVIWFNPPFSKHVKTNIGRRFIDLIDKHFPKHHRYHIIFNRNSLKLSYCTMDNMAGVIRKHNDKILNPPLDSNAKKCNCREKLNCPLQGNCQQTNVIYKAKIIHKDDKNTEVEKIYYGTATDFKTRYNNHNATFKNKNAKEPTRLCSYVHQLKEKDKNYSISWSIAARASPYRIGSGRCNLCTTEKLCIMQHQPPESLLNRRNELLNKCRHKAPFMLKKLRNRPP